jgi:hypothetical protein
MIFESQSKSDKARAQNSEEESLSDTEQQPVRDDVPENKF